MISQETETFIDSILPAMLEKAEEGRQARFQKYLLKHLRDFAPEKLGPNPVDVTFERAKKHVRANGFHAIYVPEDRLTVEDGELVLKWPWEK